MEKQQRKTGIKRGQRSQRRMNFMIDEENAKWLDSQPNKSRAINDALQQFMNH